MSKSAMPRKCVVRVAYLMSVGVAALSATVPSYAASQQTQVPQDSGAVAPSEAIEQAEGSGNAGGAAAASDIIVTGSRIARTGFGTPTPVTVVGGAQLAQTNVTNVADALNQLPSFRSTWSPATTGIYFTAAGQNLADLRGLGPQRTLVLIDGKRSVQSNQQGTTDLNLIPSMMIERSEVVTGGASAAYGSNAVTGVVNLILNHRLEGLKGQFLYGLADAGDNQRVQVSLAGGTAFAGGRGHLVIAGEYEDIKGAGDIYSRDWGRKEINAIPNSGFSAVAGQGNGLPNTIIVGDTHAASQNRTGLISSAGPLGGMTYDTNGLTLRPFVRGTNSGPIFMQGGEGAGINPYYAGPLLNVPVERYTIYGRGEYEFSDALTVSLDVSHARSEARTVGAQAREVGLQLTEDNAYISSAVRSLIQSSGLINTSGRRYVAFGRTGDDLGAIRGKSTNEVTRVAVGVSGRIGGDWTYDGYYQFGQDDLHIRAANNKINARFNNAFDSVLVNGVATCRVATLAVTNPAYDPSCRPLNLLGENSWSAEAKNYAYGTAMQSTRFRQHVVAGNVQGTLFENWAGMVSIAAGAEYRTDSARGTADAVSLVQGYHSANLTAINGTIDVAEGYVETVVPLLRDVTFAKNLELNGAIRRAHYKIDVPAGESKFDATTWKVGLNWQPTDFLRIRATRSQDIRAPNVDELATTGATQVTVRDPFNGGVQAQTGQILAANAALTPEKAKTWTVGAVLTPGGGLRLSVDFFDIKLGNAISRPTPQSVLDNCKAGDASYCALIIRKDPANPSNLIDPTDGSYSLAFATGSRIRTPNLNIQAFHIQGVDVEADYRVDLARVIGGNPGTLDLRVLGTIHTKLETINPTGSVNRAGMAGFPIGLVGSGNKLPSGPDYTIDSFITWNMGGLSLTTQLRYIPKSKFDVALVGPEDDGYSVNLPNSISTNRVAARFYANLSGQVDIFSADKRKLQLFASVYNLFDKDPPVAPGNMQTNAYLFDTLGREYRMGVRFAY